MDLDIYEQYFQISNPADLLGQFHGKEDASLLVILPDPCNHFDLVQKILGAINVQDLNHVQQLLLKPSDSISLYHLIKGKDIQQVISFGFPLAQLGMHIDHRPYQIAEYQGIQMIISADLDIVSTNADHKKALWSALKKWVVLT